MGRDTIGQEVDSSAIVCTSGKAEYTAVLKRCNKLIAFRFSRPPFSFGIHSPAGQRLVAAVGYPELEGHASHALAKALLPRGAGAVFSFDLAGSRSQGKAFIEALKIFSHLANVGDCRSLVIHPASTTHFRMDDAALAQAGIAPGTIRLSIGLEDADDLIDDLKRALKIAERAS